MQQGPLLFVPGTNNLIVPRGTNISQTQGQDTHFSHMGGDKLSFYTGGKHYFHIVGEDKLFYTQGGGEIFRHKINIRS